MDDRRNGRHEPDGVPEPEPDRAPELVLDAVNPWALDDSLAGKVIAGASQEVLPLSGCSPTVDCGMLHFTDGSALGLEITSNIADILKSSFAAEMGRRPCPKDLRISLHFARYVPTVEPPDG